MEIVLLAGIAFVVGVAVGDRVRAWIVKEQAAAEAEVAALKAKADAGIKSIGSGT